MYYSYLKYIFIYNGKTQKGQKPNVTNGYLLDDGSMKVKVKVKSCPTL